MKKNWFMLTAVLVVLGACGGNDSENTAEDQDGTDSSADSSLSVNVDEAKTIFDNSCMSCHAAGSEKTTIDEGMSKEEIEDIIHNGNGKMPPVTTISDEDAETVATWLSEKDQ